MSVKSWFYLFNPEYSNYSDETKEWLQKLNRLGMGAFPPLLMVCMNKENESELLKLLKASEHFVFLVFRMSQRQSNTKNSHFYRLANSLCFNKDNTTIKSVVDNIYELTQGEYGEGDDYVYTGWFDLNKFNSYLSEQYEKNEGFYSWNGIRYFLYEYELWLQDKANGNQKISWSDFNKRNKEDTIEHIYPQTPKDASWRRAFSGYSKKQKHYLLHSLFELYLWLLILTVWLSGLLEV